MKKNKGFTLVEMLVVIGIIGLTLPAIFTINFNILKQQTKIYRITEVKRQGDFILNTMKNTIKNYAVSVHSGIPSANNKTCQNSSETSLNNAYFLDKFGNYFRFFCRSSDGSNCNDNDNDNFIASFSSVLSPNITPLNNDKVKITNFSLTCYQTNAYSTPVVSISFTISYNTTSTRPEDKAQMTYQTKIKLRNY